MKRLLLSRARALVLLAPLVSCQADPTAPSPTVSLSVDTALINETGGEAVVTLTLSGALVSELEVSLAFAGTATNAADYVVSETQVSIPAGAIQATTTITALDDDANDDDETILVAVASVSGEAAPTGQLTASITIVDDDEEFGHARFVLTNNNPVQVVERVELQILASDGSQEALVDVVDGGVGFTTLVSLSPGEKAFTATAFDPTSTEIGTCTGSAFVVSADTVEIAKAMCIDDFFEPNNEDCDLLNGACDAHDLGSLASGESRSLTGLQALDNDWFRFTVDTPGIQAVNVFYSAEVATNFSPPRVFSQSPGSSDLVRHATSPVISSPGTVVYIHMSPASNVDPCTRNMTYSVAVDLP